MKAAPQGEPRRQAIADLQVQASAIENLPTNGVDLEAVQLGLDGATLLREYAQTLNSGQNVPLATFIDGFIFGYTGEGNPFESAIQHNANLQDWGSRYGQWSRQTHLVRATLTNRYGIEFPPIIRSAVASSTTPQVPRPVMPQPTPSKSWWDGLSFAAKIRYVVLALVGLGLLWKKFAK